MPPKPLDVDGIIPKMTFKTFIVVISVACSLASVWAFTKSELASLHQQDQQILAEQQRMNRVGTDADRDRMAEVRVELTKVKGEISTLTGVVDTRLQAIERQLQVALKQQQK